MHYNAFISYKHAENDIKVAQTVQHNLEHFHIPGKLQKKYGIKRIQRIFRDKDELPITSDLSDEISAALYDADYLIVICSPNSKQSIWVAREIEFFLRNHSKRQILTVLAEGEPQDVIPEILLHGERVITNERGELQTINVALEPLSCDYRMPIKQANKEELPRLASAIIGCTYDELMNRRRQYKMRRMTAIFAGILAIALSFGGYLLYSKAQIHKNYLDSLRNQSRYLANESRRVLDKEQRILALQLALAALPDKGSERPVTPEAVRALTDATLAYVTVTGTNIDAVWNYRLPNSISDFAISPKGTTLAARDSGNTLRVWDTKTHEAYIDISDPSTKIAGMIYFDDNTILVWGQEKLTAFDTKTGISKWSYKVDKDKLTDKEAVLTPDNGVILVLGGAKLIKFDGTTGEIKATYEMPNENNGKTISSYDYAVSPDGKKIAFKAFVDGLDHVAGIYDTETGNTIYSGIYEGRIRDLAWAGDDRIMLSNVKDSYTSSMTISTTTYLNQDHTQLECLDAKTLTKKWDHDFVSTEVVLGSGFMPILQDNQVAYYAANIAEIYDLDTGTCYYSHNVNSSIIDMSDRDGDGWPLYITTDGQMASPLPSGGVNSVSVVDEFTDDLDKVQISNGVYVHQSFSNDIIYYALYVADDEWQELDENLHISQIYDDFTLDDNILAIQSSEEGAETLTLIDPNIDRVLWRITSDDHYQFAITSKLLGARNGYYYLVQVKGIDMFLTTINLSTGEVNDTFLSDVSTLTNTIADLKDDKLLYLFNDPEKEFSIGMYDTLTGKTKSFPVGNDYRVAVVAPMYLPEAEMIYYSSTHDEFLIDTVTGKTVSVELPYGWAGTKYSTYDKNEKLIIISDESSIAAIDAKGALKYYFTCPGTAPLGLYCLNDEILVPYSNGSLYCYKTTNGDFVRKIDLSVFNGSNKITNIEYDSKQQLLYLQNGQATNVIDTKNWYEVTCVKYCLGHHSPTDRFVAYSYNRDTGYHIGYFKHYTVDELIEKGNKLLSGFEMTDEEKSEYGIDD